MVTRDVFQVLKLHSPAARAILRTFKTSLVPIYHVMHSRSYDFLYISYVASRISRSNGIIAKLRHFLTLPQMRQLYYSIIYPYISYAILAWGSAYKSHIKKIQTKQNHAIRLIFFARTLGKSTESALPLLNLLDVLTVNNIYRLHILKFTHLWHKGLLPVLFQSYFQYASSVHGYNTRYASKQNLYKPKSELTLENKQ